MAENYMQKLFANRIGGEKFGKKQVKNKMDEAVKAYEEKHHKNGLNLSMTEADSMADYDVTASLSYEAAQWGNRSCAENGIPEFKEAAAHYLYRQFQVEGLNAQTEINHTMGTKSALVQIAQAFMNEGDILLTTAGEDNSLSTMTEWLGAEVYELPLHKENKYLPNLEEIPAEVLKKAKLLYLNYPNSPTGAVANKAFFKKVVKFAKTNHIGVIHDAGYAALTYDGLEPLSFLTIPGAKQVGIEIHSLSEAFNMAGWRLGFVAGNAKMVQAFAAAKAVNDSGQFRAIQRAAMTALNKLEITEVTKAKYSRRLDNLVRVFSEMGFAAEKPKATYYLYMPIPKGTKDGMKFKNAQEFALYFAEETGIIVRAFDKNGAYICVSATFQALESEEYGLYEDIRQRCQSLQFVFK